MSITIENAEVEALLADLTETTRRTAPDLLLDVLRRERARMSDEAERRIAEGLAADEAMRRRLAADQEREAAAAIESGRLLHERTHASELVDPRPIDEILAYDENGLPV